MHHEGRALTKDWTATADSFREFLTWLDEGAESNGEKYLQMRRRLVLYFDRKNCLGSDELADETLSRVAAKLQEKGAITDLSPAHYCYIVAKFVFLEYLRRTEHSLAGAKELERSVDARQSSASPAGDVSGAREQLVDDLERCLSALQPEDRELILDYYRGDGRTKIEGRRRLAERLGLSANALTIKACRIRNKVEECVRKRAGGR